MKKKIKAKKKLTAQGTYEDSDTTAADVEKTKKGGRSNTVDYQEFVRFWKDAESVSDVATMFNIKTTSASAIANRLRNGGVDLKKFPRRGAQVIDVKKLNRIVAGKED